MSNRSKEEETESGQMLGGDKSAVFFNSLISSMNRGIDKLPASVKKNFFPATFFILIIAIGIFARAWEYRQLPPGLNQDEASIGVEAYDLLHFGVDRNGISFPVNFVSWGNGMDALYGYVLIPFMLFGLSPLTVRLPILLTGLLSMPLVYWIGKRSLGNTAGLLAMFLLAISPWHILLSRWGINENILPFVFALGFACLLESNSGNRWFVAAAFFFGLSLYAYGGTYIAIPIFMACVIPILMVSRRVSKSTLVLGVAVFSALAIPIVLFVLVNTLGWDTIHLGIFTIPRLPSSARFLKMAVTSSQNPFITVVNNGQTMLNLLFIKQTDGSTYNVVEPFGYLYSFSFPLAMAGAALLLPFRKAKKIPEKLFLLAWLFAALSIGLAQRVNINRIDLVFLPIILCTAACLAWVGSHRRLVLAVLVTAYLVNFVAFNETYHGSDYRDVIINPFFAGLLPALNFARQQGDNPICISRQVNMPYIFVLFAEHMDPKLYLDSIQYVDPAADFRQVLALGRYRFGLENCLKDQRTIFILGYNEAPNNGAHFTTRKFTYFHVFTPVATSK